LSQLPWAKRTRRTLRVWAIRAALWLGAALPFRLTWMLGGLAGRVAWWVARRDRNLAIEHLARAMPELQEGERRAIARASFIHFGHAAAEIAQADHIQEYIERYVVLDDKAEALAREAFSGGKGIVCITGHLGNWELLIRRIVKAGFPFTVVAARSWDPRLDTLIEGFRLRGGVPTVFREDPTGGRKLLKSFREGKGLGILIDQDTKVQSVFVPFFGHLASTPRAAADLAMRFGVPVYAGASRRRGSRPGDGYEVVWEHIPYDPEAPDKEAEALKITAEGTAALERFIRRAPAEWVWMHRRWKTKPPESR
jgi:Kdo2-lipid IVA lauroyltransferase/acyltransferase